MVNTITWVTTGIKKMKITKSRLKKIIAEEKARLLEQEMDIEDQRAMDMGLIPFPDGTYAGEYSGDVEDVSAAQEQIEVILNDLYDKGVENDGLKALLNNIIRDIDEGFVGEPT